MTFIHKKFIRRTLAFGLVAVLLVCSAAADARGQVIDKALKGVSGIPAMKGIAVNELKALKTHFAFKLGSQKRPAIAFTTGNKSKPIWNVAVYPKSAFLNKLYNRKDDRVLGELSLINPAIIVSAATSKTKFTALPKPVQDGIKKVFGTKVKEVTYPAGVNFSFTLVPTRTPGLSALKPALGIAHGNAAMAGAMGADLVRYLANGKRTTTKKDIQTVSLTSVSNGTLSKAKLQSFSFGQLVISYRGSKDGTVARSIRTRVTTLTGDKKKTKLTFATALTIDPKAKSADKKRIAITGSVTPALKKPLAFGGRKARGLFLDAAVMGNNRLAVLFKGKSDKKKPFSLAARLQKKGSKDTLVLEATFPENPTVKDIIAYSRPGLDKLPFNNLKMAGDVVTGTVRITGHDMQAYAFKADAKAKVRHLALVPKVFSFGAWIPGIKNSPLDGAKVSNAALLVVPDGAGKPTPLKELPKLVAEKITAVVDKNTIRRHKNKLPVADGLNLYTRVDVRKSTVLKTLLGGVGVKEPSLSLVGSVNPLVFGVLPEKTGAQMKKDKKISETVLKTFRLAASIPKVSISGLEKVLTFAGGELRFRGGSIHTRTGSRAGRTTARVGSKDLEVVAEIENTVKVKLPGKTLSMTSQINLHGGTDGKSYEIGIVGKAGVGWQRAFGLAFMDLEKVGLAATLNVDKKGGRTFVGGLPSTVKLGRQKIDAILELIVINGAIPDFSLAMKGRLELATLPGLSKIPGIKDFAFEDYRISKSAIQGKLIWKPLSYKAAAAVVKIENDYAMFARVHNLSLGTLYKKLPKPVDLLSDLKFPRAMLAFSALKLTGFELRNMPEAVQEMLKDIITNPANDVPIWDGVTLIGAVGEKDLPDDLQRIIAKDLAIFDHVDGNLVLAGGLNGLFSGNPKIGLYADMPGFKFPKNQPWASIVSLDKTKANFFIRGDVAGTMINIGVGGGMQVTVPHLDDPKKSDKIAFIGEAYASADAVSEAGGVKVAGRVKGKWRDPFGLKNYTFENPAVLLGADTEGSVEFGVGTTAEFATQNNQKLRFASDFVVNINFSTTIPLPKKLGFRMQGKKLSEMARLEVADAVFRGVLTGPMAKVIVAQVKNPVEKKAATYLQKELEKRSLLDILQVDKLPVPYIEYRDVDIYFATPGAVIPGREDTLNGMGLVVAGKTFVGLMGKKTQLNEVDNRLTLADGLKLYAKFPQRDLGPIKLKAAHVDAAANIQELPYFKIKGDVSLFGADQKLDIELSRSKIGFETKLNLGPLLQVDMLARSAGDNLFKAKAFEAKIKGAAIAGLAFTETTAKFDGRSGLEFTSTSEIPIGLPLGPVGTLGKAGATADVKVNDRTGHRLYDIAFATETLGFGGAVGFKFEGTPRSMDIAYGARDKKGANRHPCIPFSGNTHLSQGDLAAFGKRAAKGALPPEAFRELVNFKADIELPSLSGAKDCGSRVLGVAKDIADKARKAAELAAKKAFEETEKLRKATEKSVRVAAEKAAAAARNEAKRAAEAARGEIERATQKTTNFAKSTGGTVFRFAGDGVGFSKSVINSVGRAFKSAACKIFGCSGQSASDCKGDERYISSLEVCFRTGFKMMRIYIPRHSGDMKCLDVRRSETATGTNVIKSDCHGYWNQAWRLHDDGRIQNADGKCLGVHRSYGHNQEIAIYPCGDGSVLYTIIDIDGQLHMRDRHGKGHLCLNFDGKWARLLGCPEQGDHNAARIAWYDPFVQKVVSPGKEWIKTVGLSSEFFDADYYLKRHRDIHNKFGATRAGAARHWILEGMREGRQGNASFYIKAYRDRASWLRNTYKDNWLALYRQWDKDGRRDFLAGRASRNPRPEGWKPPVIALRGRDNWAFTKSNLVNLGGLCVDEASGKLTAGGQVIVSGCGAGARQNWSHNKRGQIVSSNKYYCLDVESGTARDKEPIIIWGCRGSGAELQRQRWRLANYGAIQHIDSGLCLDSTKDGNPGGKLVLSPCSDTSTQIWKARTEAGVADPVIRNMYMSTNDDAFCLDTWPNHTAPVGSRSCINHGNLRFSFWSDKTIRHDPKDLCLNVQRGGANGAPVVVANCENHPDQRWEVHWSGGRVPSDIDPTWPFQIVHRASGRCLDLSNGTGGGRAVTRNCGGSRNADTWPDSQTWRSAQSPP